MTVVPYIVARLTRYDSLDTNSAYKAQMVTSNTFESCGKQESILAPLYYCFCVWCHGCMHFMSSCLPAATHAQYIRKRPTAWEFSAHTDNVMIE